MRKIVSLLPEVSLDVMSSKDTGEGKFRARNGRTQQLEFSTKDSNKPGSHYSDFSARNRRFLGETSRREIIPVHITMISRREIGEKSPISRRDIAEKISRPTERHVTSHVIDLDICKFLIMDASR